MLGAQSFLGVLGALLLFTGLISGLEEHICTAGSTGASWQHCRGQPPSRILIRNGVVVNADAMRNADVLIEDGLILAVEPSITAGEGDRVIDAQGMYVMPGGIDPHTHLDMPFMGALTADDFASGQRAALAGGTTMHIDFALPVGGDLLAGWDAWTAKAERAVMDYGFHMAVTTWSEKVAADMAELVQRGINSFKFFLAYKGVLMVSDEQLLAGLARCKALGALPMVHAENGDAVALGQETIFNRGITGPEGHPLSRPSELEGEATGRAIRLANFVNVPLYVVHVMSKHALDEISRARHAGQRVVGEPVASGLALEESLLWGEDFDTAAKYVMSPPIRSQEHRAALQAALSTGVLQLVATDHCTFNSTQKAAGRHDFRLIPNGVNGIEERMHVVWDTMVNSGRMSPSDFVRVTSTECAKIFNLFPRKGLIAVGSDADIILLNPNTTFTISAKTHHSKTNTNVYEGRQMTGKVEVTISRGRVVWEHGQLAVEPRSGRYIPMPPFGPLFFGLEQQDQARWRAYRAPVVRK